MIIGQKVGERGGSRFNVRGFGLPPLQVKGFMHNSELATCQNFPELDLFVDFNFFANF
jgi:hypothetical protein